MHRRHTHHGRCHDPRGLFRGGMKSPRGQVHDFSWQYAVPRKSRTCPRDCSTHDLIERLENHQRDLEQQLADIADVLAHLRDRSDATSETQQA